jgi:hypothetical protein
MKTFYKSFLLVSPLLVLFIMSLMQLRCTPQQTTQMNHDQMVQHGKYMVTVMSCNDCHSPKVFTADGPVADTTRLLSGSPSTVPLPKIDTNSLHPGYWYTGSPDLTAWVGPWGISFAANLTPDSTTGIGAWSEETFINTLRSGKHLGLKDGRQILPPMPWNFIAVATDDDLKAIFAYLKSLPPIHNQVHAPIAPPDVRKM